MNKKQLKIHRKKVLGRAELLINNLLEQQAYEAYKLSKVKKSFITRIIRKIKYKISRIKDFIDYIKEYE